VIPKDFITEWRDRTPWVLDRQVEQDLVISRALVELFSRKPIADSLAFRGGTALYKLHITPAARYSEDIDLVQTTPGGIGEVLDAIHAALDPWLGAPKWKQTEGRVTLAYRFDSEDIRNVSTRVRQRASKISEAPPERGLGARPRAARRCSLTRAPAWGARPTGTRRLSTRHDL
jgi:hypothetical protein